jgi:hypothetical protein
MYFDDLDFSKTLVGVLSIAVSTASGTAALLVDFKDKSAGKITKWGRYALAGLAVSFLIGTLNQFIDYTAKSRQAQEAAKKAQESSEKTLQIITDLSRTLNPLKDVRAGFWIAGIEHPELASYKKRLQTAVEAISPRLRSLGDSTNGVSVETLNSEEQKPTEVRINQRSPLWPDAKKERLAYALLTRTGLSAKLYKTPIPAGSLENPWLPAADISMPFEPKQGTGNTIRYDVKGKRIILEAYTIPSNPLEWNSSGEITSQVDLAGSQMVVEIPHVWGPELGDNSRPLAPKLSRLVLDIAGRRPWVFQEDDFEYHESNDGFARWSFVFPRTFPEVVSYFDREE